MKITRRDLGVIMLLVGILVVFLVYKMSFEQTQAEIEQLQNEQKDLQSQIDALQPFVEKAPVYEKSMKKIQDKIQEVLKEYPDDIWQEDNIMYVVEMLEELNISIPSFSAQPAGIVSQVSGEGALAEQSYTMATAALSFAYSVDSYDDMKDMVKFIYGDKEHVRAINQVSVSMDKESGKVTGNINISQYVITDDSSKYKEIELPLEEIGLESGCVFGETVEAEE